MSRLPHTFLVLAALVAVVTPMAALPELRDRIKNPTADARSQENNAGTNGAKGYEVWLVDQSNTIGKSYGGRVYIYAGADLESAEGEANVVPIHTIELGGEVSDLCFAETGAYPVRPHMCAFNNAHTHNALAFVVSGHVVFFDALERKPLRCIRSELGTNGNRQAHAVNPTPDDKYMIVANQNGKKLERIATDYTTNTFTHERDATLNLMTCDTPSGQPCELLNSPYLRPDNAPICWWPATTGEETVFYTTLRGGGMFVIDPYSTPMRIVADYDATVISANGCGRTLPRYGTTFFTGGNVKARPSVTFAAYMFPPNTFETYSGPNKPAPQELITCTDGSRDGHAVGYSLNEKYAWVYDRTSNTADVFNGKTGEHVNVVNLTSSLSEDPAPDIVTMNAVGTYSFVALRGPYPQSGGHAAIGNTPGLGVIKHTNGGVGGFLKARIPISNVYGGKENADPHGIRALFYPN